jgi:hypothetical protein
MLRNMITYAGVPEFVVQLQDDKAVVRAPQGHRIKMSDPSREGVLELIPHDLVDGDVMVSVWSDTIQEIWSEGWWDLENPPTWDEIHDIESDVDIKMFDPILDSRFDGEHPESAGLDRTNIATLRPSDVFESEEMAQVGWGPGECKKCGMEDPHRMVLHQHGDEWLVEHRVNRRVYSCGQIIGRLNPDMYDWIETEEEETSTDEVIGDVEEALNADDPLDL